MTTADADRYDAELALMCLMCRQWTEARLMTKAVSLQWGATGTATWLDLCHGCSSQCKKCGVYYPDDEIGVVGGVLVCDPCSVYDQVGDTREYRAELARWTPPN